ncbi:MAG: hypothetical protein LKJ88_04040 [Bacilli bacterium]|jgi:hypothetical protein|nr:hypothetical protein [Bacilli bacterium]
MPTSLRKDDKSALEDNFIVYDDPRFGANEAGSVFLLPALKNKKEALALLNILLKEYPYVSMDPSSSFKLKAKKDGREIFFSLNQEKDTFLWTVKGIYPSSLRNPCFQSSETSFPSDLKKLLKKGWSRKEQDFENAKREALRLLKKEAEDPCFKLKKLLGLNILEKTGYGESLFGEEEKIASLTYLDVDLALKNIMEEEKISIYIGNTYYRPVLNYRSLFKPSERIFPFSFPNLEIGAIKDLETVGKGVEGDYLGLVYKSFKADSELSYLLSLLLKRTIYSFKGPLNQRLLASGMGLINCESDLFLGFDVLFISLKGHQKEEALKIVKEVKETEMEKEFSFAKGELEKELLNGSSSLDEVFSFLLFSRLSGLKLQRDVLETRLQGIDYPLFKKALNTPSYMGSLLLKGDLYD